MELPTTHWTMLAQASLHGDRASATALDEFCRRYRSPIVAMIRRRGVLESRIEDLAHDFLMQLMTHSSLQRVDSAKGRFRQYLIGALSCFLADDVKKNQAQKRGGGARHLSLDADDGIADGLTDQSPDLAATMDREWALHLVLRAMERLAGEWERAGKAERFAVLRLFLPGAPEVISHAEASARLGLSDTALRSELFRLRSGFRAAVRSEVATTVDSQTEVDDEMQYLLQVLQTIPILFSPRRSADS